MLLHDSKQLRVLNVPYRLPAARFGQEPKIGQQLAEADVGRKLEEFKREAVRMLLDGHSARSVAGRLGLSNAQALYRWPTNRPTIAT